MTALDILSKEGIQRIHEAALQILAEVGIRVNDERLVNMLRESGARTREGSIVYLPEVLVCRCIQSAPRQVLYGSRNKKHNLLFTSSDSISEIHSRPVTGSEGYVDLSTRAYRKALLSDTKEWARLVDGLEHVSFCAGPYPHDVPLAARDVHAVRAMIENTEKHVELQTYSGKNMEYICRLALAVQTEAELRNEPLISVVISALSPLTFDTLDTDPLVLCGRHGIPVALSSSPIGGATGPVTLTGAALLSHTELMAGVVISQVANPGAPVIYRPEPLIFDMRRGIALVGPIERAAVVAMLAQLARQCCNIPASLSGPCTDSLVADAQAMIEKVFMVALPAMAGSNSSAGMGQLEAWYTVDPVQLVIDNEILAMAKRALRGIDTEGIAQAVEAIRRVGPGGDFLTDSHTLSYFKSEYMPSDILNRMKREEWTRSGCRDLAENAKEKALAIVNTHVVPTLETPQLEELNAISREADHVIGGT